MPVGSLELVSAFLGYVAIRKPVLEVCMGSMGGDQKTKIDRL